MRSKTKQGNYILDNIDADVILDYVYENFFDSIREVVLENEAN